MAHPVLFGLLGSVRHFPHSRRCAVAGATPHGGGGCGGASAAVRSISARPTSSAVASVAAAAVAGSGGSATPTTRATMVKAPPADVAGSLELNQRQRELFDDVVAKAKAKLAPPSWPRRSRIIGREPFERDALEFLVGKGELADDLEHLHFSLTPEQRAKLRAVASA